MQRHAVEHLNSVVRRTVHSTPIQPRASPLRLPGTYILRYQANAKFYAPLFPLRGNVTLTRYGQPESYYHLFSRAAETDSEPSPAART